MDDREQNERRDESERLRRAREGDSDAVEDLYRHFEAPLRRYLDRKTGAALARAVSISDLCQETFVQALGALRVLPAHATFDDFRGVLFRHALWMLGKHAERNREFVGESVLGERSACDDAPQSERTSGELTRLDEIGWIREQLERLDPDHAAVLRLRFEGQSFAQIAAALDIREGAARQRFLRGSRELRRVMQVGGDDEALRVD